MTNETTQQLDYDDELIALSDAIAKSILVNTLEEKNSDYLLQITALEIRLDIIFKEANEVAIERNELEERNKRLVDHINKFHPFNCELDEELSKVKLANQILISENETIRNECKQAADAITVLKAERDELIKKNYMLQTGTQVCCGVFTSCVERCLPRSNFWQKECGRLKAERDIAIDRRDFWEKSAEDNAFSIAKLNLKINELKTENDALKADLESMKEPVAYLSLFEDGGKAVHFEGGYYATAIKVIPLYAMTPEETNAIND